VLQRFSRFFLFFSALDKADDRISLQYGSPSHMKEVFSFFQHASRHHCSDRLLGPWRQSGQLTGGELRFRMRWGSTP
jgi:hypothetical protein